ncbi:GatB/YqeY domain-containing protein [Immundisolibacter sp.]|uniref:GatB/YqeY domain-containing protein n=1 Tax=Immundisolibacter sp. TaxID=1934948 RepID=UPI002603653E|nr:GatB/YqeY domain-containing protein [Immundisolibacter sp.]MDD3650211.1 GatB/YqeY domain-containing protein [Immundisolibacter sp.]
MSLKQRLDDDVKAAMRARDRDRLGTLRLITAAIKQREVDERITLDDAQVLAVIDKMVKQRRESIAQFDAAGRTDLADKERAELAILQEFLPAALGEAELEQLIDEAIAASGAQSARDMGAVMALLRPKVQGRADMADVSRRVKARLG